MMKKAKIKVNLKADNTIHYPIDDVSGQNYSMAIRTGGPGRYMMCCVGEEKLSHDT